MAKHFSHPNPTRCSAVILPYSQLPCDCKEMDLQSYSLSELHELFASGNVFCQKTTKLQLSVLTQHTVSPCSSSFILSGAFLVHCDPSIQPSGNLGSLLLCTKKQCNTSVYVLHHRKIGAYNYMYVTQDNKRPPTV